MGESQKNPSHKHVLVGVCSPVKCKGFATHNLPPCLDPPKSKWHNVQSRLTNQTFIKRRGRVCSHTEKHTFVRVFNKLFLVFWSKAVDSKQSNMDEKAKNCF